ncbi:peptidylprolyl isomerase [Deinococcus sp. Marseille-Q6407]|uniref:peptidylprolyl isomerase n=1 Tax=Deinococcus sp. Marseille-Q6407 TaxID=2969223 RepID=UPI0021BF8C49|nr:peptidylprolyl isomerase [Deinococcus sp. Marseille-Q6407]
MTAFLGRVWRCGTLLGLLSICPGAVLAAAPAPAGAVPAVATPATVADAAPAQEDLLAVIGSGPSALRLTRADFERAFRLAVGELLNRQGLPLRDDLFQAFAPSRSQFFEQYVRDRKTEYLARQALPDFVYSGPPRIGPQSFARPQGYADYLSGAGYQGEADYLQEMARRALTEAYRQQLLQRFTFSDAAVRNFYDLNRARFVQRDEACARHILVLDEAQARDLRQLLLSGADFALLAQSESRDPGSASRGGDLGCFAPGQTADAFDTALFAGILGAPRVVQTDQGWHVLEVTERRRAGLLPLEQAAPQVRESLARSAAARLLNTQLAQVPAQLFPEHLMGGPQP